MATILILTHERDRFPLRSYMLPELIRHWRGWGHRVLVHASPRQLPRADVAILHVDLTVIPEEYVATARDASVCLNLGTADISKRHHSVHLVRSPGEYDGPVVVKTNLNSQGWPETAHGHSWLRLALACATLAWRMKLARAATAHHGYRTYERPGDVPPNVWSDPGLVVEKFLPERDENGYYLRTWLFFGDRECCNRVRSSSPIVKGRAVMDRTPVPVPPELRARRRELGFDYGKFDFVLRDGVPVLFDANRTPGLPPSLRAPLRDDILHLARGIKAYV
jgi:hypothetical protein